MSTLLNVLLFLSAFVLIVLVLIQPDRSHGMTASMGLGASNTIFGINKDGGPLAKATEVVATLFIICSLLLYLTRWTIPTCRSGSSSLLILKTS